MPQFFRLKDSSMNVFFLLKFQKGRDLSKKYILSLNYFTNKPTRIQAEFQLKISAKYFWNNKLSVTLYASSACSLAADLVVALPNFANR